MVELASDAVGVELVDLHKHFGENQQSRLTTAQIKDREAIIDALKTFLGKGK